MKASCTATNSLILKLLATYPKIAGSRHAKNSANDVITCSILIYDSTMLIEYRILDRIFAEFNRILRRGIATALGHQLVLISYTILILHLK